MKHGVDIIIPVYNALDDLKICLESIYKYTDITQNRLILINDKSPDDRVMPFLEEQKKYGAIVIHNEHNMGFSANINLGMKQSAQNDVILLNSDTIVTKGWVGKLIQCAYSSVEIGTVTPLSNNATLCSVPDFCQENNLPEGLTVDETAAIVEECSLCKYPRITVAHGFCMYIKRDVIRKVGFFDAETFGRGYGEENDFCNRAEQMGYIHVMCDNTYIYHSGTKSFVSQEKMDYIREHEKILEKRYPDQMQKNRIHCRDNPNGWVGNNTALYFTLWNGRKNLLYVLHSDFREEAKDHIGGTQLHVKQLVHFFRKEQNVFVAAREGNDLCVTAYAGEKEFTFRFRIGEQEQFPLLRDRRLASVYAHILRGFKIDLVHVHHTANTSLDIFYEAQKLGIPVLYTVHDYYCICPGTTLVDAKGDVCVGRLKCDAAACLRQKKDIYDQNDYLGMWRQAFSEALSVCRNIIVPSQSTKSIFSAYYPELAEKIMIVEHGTDTLSILDLSGKEIIYTDEMDWTIEKVDRSFVLPLISGKTRLQGTVGQSGRVLLKITDQQEKTVCFPTNICTDVTGQEIGFSAFLPRNIWKDGDLQISVVLERDGKYYAAKNKSSERIKLTFTPGERLKIAFIGGINEDKGGKLAAEIIQKTGNQFEWYVIGGIGEAKLGGLHRKNLIKTGYYHQQDIYTFLQYYQMDVICILSKCPETFSYTLSEALQCHVPVIVTDVGALGQRVRDNHCGCVVNPEEKLAAEEVIQILEAWEKRDETYQSVNTALDQYCPVSASEMAQRYHQLYNHNYALQHAKVYREDMEQLYRAYTEAGGVREDEQERIKRLRELESRMAYLDNNLTFRFFMKASQIRFPLKQKIRAWLLAKYK